MLERALVRSKAVRTSARALWVSLFFGAACGSGVKEPTGPERPIPQQSTSKGRVPERPPALRATELGRVPNVTYGPYLGHGPQGGLVVWAALTERRRTFSAVALSTKGRPEGPVRTVAEAPETLGLVAVRAVARGYLIVHTRPSPEGSALSVLCVDPLGHALGTATPGSLPGSALWIDAVPVGRGALVFFGTRPDPKKHLAEIGVLPLDAECRATELSILAQNVLAWQAVASSPGAILALVRPSGGVSGGVEAILVDPLGKPKTTTSVSRDAAADLDLDAARVGDNVVLAWTDRRALEPRLIGAAVDPLGKLVAPPEALTVPEGEQTLLKVVPPAHGNSVAFLAWENLTDRPLRGRLVQLSRLDQNAKLTGPRARLRYEGDESGVPELCATSRGLALLTIASACRRDSRCEDAQIGPTFVELDRELQPLATEPLRLEPLHGASAELGFGLGCTAQGCFSVAALTRTPAPIFAVELEARSASFVPPVISVDRTTTPRVLAHEALSSGPSFAAFAHQSVSGKEYLATLSNFDPSTPWKRLDKPAPDGRFDPLRARLTLERLGSGPRVAEKVPASLISLRAHSFGGVAIAPGKPDRGEFLVAWAGVDQRVPQGFLTLVDRSGGRVLQRMFTLKKGDFGDIAAAWVGDGWVVAWVDGRVGDLEVFTAKFDGRLNRVGLEQRITQARGTAADPSLAFDGKTLRLVWSDARGADVPGHADIFSVELGVGDAKPIGNEARLGQTRAHSFSPSVQPAAGGFVVAWAERGDKEGEPGTIVLSRVGVDGVPSPTIRVASERADPRSVGLACAGEICRLAAIVERESSAALAVTSWSGAGTPGALREVLNLVDTTGAAVPPVIQGDAVLFVDASASQARVRRARLVW